ncbi:hypothetical protein [Muricoccus pecuniae]|uniref:FAD dependent oxidoreductase n=1 Tax=Muricoccus pecuniae TaxID=693023 RepID=A0A840YI13_9PROT|nr:hypothetical protein [Roseomonas pecuniae]MBB5693534.1 hypothetical protein [Roseomonas pecuniae]
MAINRHSLATMVSAENTLRDYRIVEGIYLLGSLSRGLTVFDQQVRAHNLAWALWRVLEAEKQDADPIRIAVVGGGIAGLTLTACLLARSSAFVVTQFEERWDLCPLQQGSDTRWLHPHIYRWPKQGSRAPDAGLPVLNWTEGRASDVSREVLEGFGNYAHQYGEGRLALYLGMNHLRIGAADRTIEWMGRKGCRRGAYIQSGEPHGDRCGFDVVILATGFGLEKGAQEAEGSNSYWRNDRLGQPQLSGSRATYLVSGFGDGALVDLCRLTVERFRQDTILYELFGHELEIFEDELRGHLGEDFGRSAQNVYDIMQCKLSPASQELMRAARQNLLQRLRKDTIVILHASGRDGTNTSLRDLFDPHSSVLNRTLLYLLYQCGGFVLSLGELDDAVREYAVRDDKVVKRYGADTLQAVKRLFSDPDIVSARLDDMKANAGQIAERRWPLGAFPHISTVA